MFKYITFRIACTIHKKIKQKCVDNEITMKQYLLNLIEKDFERDVNE